MSNMIQNPLINNFKLYKNPLNIIKRDFSNIYILTLKENIIEIDDSIYHYIIDKELYNNISKNLLLIKAPISLIDNFKDYSRFSVLSESIIETFNCNNYKFQNNNLVLQIFNISYENIKLFLSQYEEENNFINIYKKIIINKYFNSTNLKIITNSILNMNEPNNCINNLFFINYTFEFEYRKINNNCLKSNNILFENYLNDDKKKTSVFDKYKININTDFTKEEITNLIIELPDKPRFLLFCNLIITEGYSHLILNNKELLIFMKPVIEKFIQLFRYLFSYAWIILYIDELNKKSYIKKDDQCIFTIDTASNLPLFPFSINNPKMNPYCPILIDDNILNSEYNIGGILDYKENIFNKVKNNKYKIFFKVIKWRNKKNLTDTKI